MTAPAPSPAEQEQIDRFGIFAEERVVEEVARAMYESCYGGTWDLTWEEFCETPAADSGYYRRLARAALAAMQAQVADDQRQQAAEVRHLEEARRILDTAPLLDLGGAIAAALADAERRGRAQDGGAEEAVRLNPPPELSPFAGPMLREAVAHERAALAPQAGEGRRPWSDPWGDMSPHPSPGTDPFGDNR